MYQIYKTFTADLAHRIHNQTLDKNFTENDNPVCKCRHFHGHTVSIIVSLKARDLKDDMVADFNEIGFVKKLINKHLDHHLMISMDDPLFQTLVLSPLRNLDPSLENWHDRLTESEYTGITKHIYSLNLDGLDKNDPLYELLDGVTITDWTTSSENYAKYFYEVVSKKFIQYNADNKTDVQVAEVSYMETPSSKSTYSE